MIKPMMSFQAIKARMKSKHLSSFASLTLLSPYQYLIKFKCADIVNTEFYSNRCSSFGAVTILQTGHGETFSCFSTF
jgi:hypothetical protein